MALNYHGNFDRIVGGLEKEKKEASAQIEKWNKEKPSLAESFEVPKTEKERKIIRYVESSVDNVIRRYGGDPKPLSGERVVLVTPGAVRRLTNSRFEHGLFSPLGQYVVVERTESDVQFALTLAHELFHLKSPKAARVSKEGAGDLRLYRSGFVLVDRKNEREKRGEETQFFKEIEEAIVAEATQQVYNLDFRHNPQFMEEIEAVDAIKDYLRSASKEQESNEPIRIIMKSVTEAGWAEFLSEIRTLPPRTLSDTIATLRSKSYDRHEKLMRVLRNVLGSFARREADLIERNNERKRLNELMDVLSLQLPGKPERKEEVFNEFARANFTGNYMYVARLIEKAMGKGSFRRLASEFGKPSSR